MQDQLQDFDDNPYMNGEDEEEMDDYKPKKKSPKQKAAGSEILIPFHGSD